MPRTFAIAAILTVSVLGAAQADEGLAGKVHAAAVKACAVEASALAPSAHYDAITSACVRRISSSAMRKYAVEAELRMKASTALNTATN